MGDQKVVVTGMGTINPLGKNIPEFWKNCIAGSSGVCNVSTLFDIPIPAHMSQVAGVVQIPFKDSNERIQERNLLFTELAVQEALKDAALLDQQFDDQRCGVFIATAIAEIALMEWSFNRYKQGIGHVGFIPLNAPYFGRSFFFNHIARVIASKYGLKGGAVTIATGCTGGNDAIGYALHMIRGGKVEIAITGATEAPITPLVITAFNKIGATSKRNDQPTKASRPFDKNRDGFVLAEGCGILILESLSHAQKRGAHIYAEIKGMGSINNCYHMTDIPQDGESIAKACQLALRDAQVEPSQVDYINAHGSSTPQNDIAETHAFYRIFGNRAREIPVTSIKSQLGHALSAANSLEVISAILSIRDNIIPPTINLDMQDPACPLKVVANKALESEVTTILKTSSGFSGIHSSLVLGKI
ncbi:MAG: beta-ketoacyl-[acyl-carrier-protein] synthase family protein [Chlamydiae bacterium]|nr:beta-ketoacyl-[acyl-carrier-protein] synthase family protein [Chlamydiota bacterium]